MTEQKQAHLAGGLRTWSDFVVDAAGYTLLWQDLDGLRVTEVPSTPPSTSMIHGWNPGTGALLRARLNGDDIHLAVLTPTGDGEPVAIHVDELFELRHDTRGLRGADRAEMPLGRVTTLDHGRAPLVFMCPVDMLERWR